MRGCGILFIVGVIFLVGDLCSIGSTAVGMEKSVEGLMAKEGCSGSYSFGENNDPILIPDYPGYFDPFAIGLSSITISGPSGRVNCIEVHYEIVHSWVGDLEVVLTDEDFSQLHYLWNNEGGGADNINETETGITTFNGEKVNQTWYLLAVDTFGGDIGYIDSWWIKVYYEQGEPLANDDCANAIAVEEAVPYEGNTIGATGDYHSGWGDTNDVNDVWYSFTPNSTDLFKISLSGSTFDTTLAVFDQCGGTELASNDDSCEDVTSEIQMLMAAGKTYFIRVAGFYYDQGDYILTVTSSPALLPTEPDKLSPVNGAVGVQTDTILSWNCTIEAAKQVQDNNTAETSSKNTMRYKAIYGKDDRVEEYNVTDVNILAVGDSTAILVPRSDLLKNSDGTFSLPRVTFAEWYFLMTGQLLCPDEPFRDQPSPGVCSGFLVAPDIIVTTGHCVCPEEISEYVFVFGFVMTDPNTAVLKINESDIYYGKEVIARQEGFPDWDLIRLGREVTGHNPLPLRHTGIIPDGQSIMSIGYPLGLPRKYTAGATVLDNNAPTYFQANLDSFGGSSGAAVFNADTLVVEGIVFAGPEDFVEDGLCDRSKVCPDTGCSEDELHLDYIIRVTEFSPLIPTFDVYLGTDPNQLNLICPGALVPWCDPRPLKASKTYYWKVVAENCYGQAEGPVSSFTTAE